MSNIKSGRALAVQCLVEMERGGYSNLVFKQYSRAANLPAREIAFAAAMFYGTLERQISLDAVLAQYIKSGIQKLDAEIRVILRSGLYQCIYLDSVPNAAAIDESVKLARQFKKSSAAGLVNAVLRKSCDCDIAAVADTAKDEAERLSLQYSVSEPLADMILQQYPGEAEQILAGFFEKKPAVARVNTLKIEPSVLLAQLREQGIEAGQAGLPAAIELFSGSYLNSPSRENGLFRLQSEAAQLAVWALAPQPGDTVFDVCAAPGGKSLTAAQMMKNQGEIFAFDKSERRLELVSQAAATESVSIIETIVADSTVLNPALCKKADRVLCDVPCSGLGELASKPELRYKRQENLAELAALQLQILQTGAQYVKPGGRLVYSTCTINRTENEQVVAHFMQNNAEFRTSALGISGAERESQKIYLPLDGMCEGFFIASFERIW